MTISDKYDVQTGYLKKEAFEEFADMAEREEKFKSVPIGVLFTDINDLKKYHDYHSHLMSDVQIRKVALAIQEATECMGEYYRFGGDEFVVVFKGFKKEQFDRYMKCIADVRESLESISFAAGDCYTESAADIRFALKTAYENMRADKERYHAEHH
ncbi:diguanylate cyclase [Ruminococcus sp.]|uniref:GGDEF domain-containing protein n=1 Tax=Ruminococcus sp. TaxID=41978 RepID=UPI00258D00D4|nr:diguanylate cyclase [Ruminococcus sp.]MCR5022264.1 GGDEF domain-containing protein [Ruminococcus sp.]